MNKDILSGLLPDRFNISFSILIVLLLLGINLIAIQFLSFNIIYVLTALAVLFLFSFNIKLILLLTVLNIFVPYILQIHSSVIVSLFLLLSVLLNYSEFETKKYKNPIILSLIIFVFAAVVSLANSHIDLYILMDFFNLIAFVLIVFTIPKIVSEEKEMQKLFLIFVLAVFFHSIIVIFNGLTFGGRTFGLLGVFYIDLAGLAFLYSIIFLLYAKRKIKYLYAILSLTILMALILTQTRNAWLSTVVGLAFLLVVLLFNSKKFLINKRIIIFSSIILFLTATVFVSYINSSADIDVSRRLDTKTNDVKLSENPASVGENSFVSRLFIWHTAVNAFMKEPVLGIGMYSFKKTSNKYYTIPKPFFKQYVENKTPHVAYLEILVETGIVGFILFLFFLFSVHRNLFQMMKSRIDEKNVITTLVIFVSIIYITFSMLMTEAWVYGQYLVWFGIIIGLLVSKIQQVEHNQTL